MEEMNDSYKHHVTAIAWNVAPPGFHPDVAASKDIRAEDAMIL